MLRLFGSGALTDYCAVGLSAVLVVVRFAIRRRRRPFVRVLLARPLWWLAARLLAVPDAHARYASFRDRALVRWEALLLGEEPDLEP